MKQHSAGDQRTPFGGCLHVCRCHKKDSHQLGAKQKFSFLLALKWLKERNKKERRKEGRKEGKKEGRKERERKTGFPIDKDWKEYTEMEMG